MVEGELFSSSNLWRNNMFIVYQNSGNLAAKNLNSVRIFRVVDSSLRDYDQGITFASYETNEEAVIRFDDILAAAVEDQKVYDLREDVGYWKPKETVKRTGRKPKAEQSEPAEHAPTPKK